LQTEGFDLGKSYIMVGCSGYHLEVINNEGVREIMSDKYFSGAGKRLGKNNK